MVNRHQKLVCYKTLTVWNAQTLPEAFKVRHNTKSGVWAKLQILSGNLTMELMSEGGEVTGRYEYSYAHQPTLIEPKQYHRIAFWSDDITCQLSFYTKEKSVED